MSRHYSQFATEEARALLDRLLVSTNNPGAYQRAMTDLGARLGAVVRETVPPSSSVLVACTVEDADYLAQGALVELSSHRDPLKIHFACFWNRRERVGNIASVTIAPIIHSYIEPPEGARVDVLVIVKSIISTACVVRTNLIELMARVEPKRIIVVAPVMHENARKGLESEFPASVARRFEYVYFVEDSTRTPSGEVQPGIGGSVYELLGFRDEADKNHYRPAIVKQRRARAH